MTLFEINEKLTEMIN